MALTDAQKAQVRRYLGYPDINREPSNLESAFDALSAEGEAVVVSILAEIATIRASISGSQTRQGIKRAEDIEFFQGGGLQALYAEGNRLAYELGAVFGIEPLRLPFSSGSGGGACLRG